MERLTDIAGLGQVCRLGLATRGNTSLDREDVLWAVDRGIHYLNWCGYADGMQDAIRGLGDRRRNVVVAVQLHARSAVDAQRELGEILGELKTDYLDVVTYYYVEHPDELSEIVSPGGAADAIEEARHEGRVRKIGLTSHQRLLAAEAAASGRLDLLMIRYNAAHRGAERDVFPVTTGRKMPVVAFTCLRWGHLMRRLADDPPEFEPPPAREWYRFVLCQPAVDVALMAPNGSQELKENLALLDDWRALSAEGYAQLAARGEQVREHAGQFP